MKQAMKRNGKTPALKRKWTEMFTNKTLSELLIKKGLYDSFVVVVLLLLLLLLLLGGGVVFHLRPPQLHEQRERGDRWSSVSLGLQHVNRESEETE